MPANQALVPGLGTFNQTQTDKQPLVPGAGTINETVAVSGGAVSATLNIVLINQQTAKHSGHYLRS